MNKKRNQKFIIHIVGSGRSGSTVLDRTLGHHSQAFSIGEFINFQKDYARNSLCGCGQQLRDCDFWGAVLKKASREARKKPEDITLDFRLQAPAAGHKLIRKYRQVKNAAGLYFNLPPRYFTDVSTFKNTGLLYEKTFEISGASVVIDSSKSITRALFLSRVLPDYNHLFIHLIRDGRGVLNSRFKEKYSVMVKDQSGKLVNKEFGKNISRSPAEAIEDWVKGNSKVEKIIKLYGLEKKSMRLRLEDFLEAPRDKIDEVLNRVQLSFEPSMLEFTYGDNHMVCGNPSRLNAMKLEHRKTDWEEVLHPDLLAIFNAIGGDRLNKKYGYQ